MELVTLLRINNINDKLQQFTANIVCTLNSVKGVQDKSTWDIVSQNE